VGPELYFKFEFSQRSVEGRQFERLVNGFENMKTAIFKLNVFSLKSQLVLMIKDYKKHLGSRIWAFGKQDLIFYLQSVSNILDKGLTPLGDPM
jgi:hypothetical protein